MAADQLRALHGSSTPGPWEVGVGGGVVYAREHVPGWGVADVRDGADTGLSDAELIAAMRNALPALLGVAEAARRCVTRSGTEQELWDALAALDERA